MNNGRFHYNKFFVEKNGSKHKTRYCPMNSGTVWNNNLSSFYPRNNRYKNKINFYQIALSWNQMKLIKLNNYNKEYVILWKYIKSLTTQSLKKFLTQK